MLSNPHEGLLQRLREVISTTKEALGKNELDGMPELISAHHNVMEQLYRAGDCREPQLIALMSEIKTEMQTVKERAEMWQAGIRKRLKATTNKDKLTRAYGNQKQSAIDSGTISTGA